MEKLNKLLVEIYCSDIGMNYKNCKDYINSRY